MCIQKILDLGLEVFIIRVTFTNRMKRLYCMATIIFSIVLYNTILC